MSEELRVSMLSKAVILSTAASCGVFMLCSSYAVIYVARATPGISNNAIVKTNTTLNAQLTVLNTRIAKTMDAADADLGEAHKLIYTANVSAEEAGRAAMTERHMLEQLNPKILEAVDAVTATTKQAGTSLADISTSAADTFAEVRPVMLHLDQTVIDVDKTVADPNIKRILTQSADTMTEIHGISQNTNATTADVKTYVHGLTHPTAIERAWTYTITGLGTVAKFLAPGW